MSLNNDIAESPAPTEQLHRVVRIGSVRLLLEERDIISIDAAPAMERSPNDRGPIGQITVGDRDCEIFALSSDLRLAREIPEEKGLLAVLNGPFQQPFAIFCDEAEAIDSASLVQHPIPACMCAPDVPLRALVAYGDEVAGVTNGAALFAAIRRECADELALTGSTS